VTKRERRYISYLVRLWRGRSGGDLVWRASLESPRTGERRGFASPADLFASIEQEMRSVAGGEAPPDADEIGRSY
jgi:hypothetical protein